MIYTLIVLAIIGIIFNKDFRFGIITAIGSAIVFTPVIIIGIIYNCFYPIFMSFKERDWTQFFKIWWRLIDGTYSFIGNSIYQGFSERYDELGNVWGEWLEDAITTEEQTTFGDKNTTISASIGYLEYHKIKIFKRGQILSKALNITFSQSRHAIGSWEKKLALQELEDRNLHGNK